LGDYWEIMSMGSFKADGSIPNEFTVMTDGWWDTEVGGVVGGALIFITAIIHHQHMAMGGRRA
jgi:hypothetical protein